jgi:hypothetical protein
VCGGIALGEKPQFSQHHLIAFTSLTPHVPWTVQYCIVLHCTVLCWPQPPPGFLSAVRERCYAVLDESNTQVRRRVCMMLMAMCDRH